MKKPFKIMIISLLIMLTIAISLLIFLQFPQFGKLPIGERLERIEKSPNYKDGKFHNQIPTRELTSDVGFLRMMKQFMFNKSDSLKPRDVIPSVKIDLRKINPHSNVLVWLGHSSFFMQIDGKKILIDPVLSGYSSPFSFITRSFKGTDVYTPDNIPDIDYLLITHDHWDHLDYQTLKRLRPRIKKVITGLGVGADLEYWGFDPKNIIEKDWNEQTVLESGFVITATPARHFSGRLFKRNKCLWVSFVIKTPTMNIFVSGDSGYGPHFAEIGNTFGPFDLAIMECGQYGKNWRYIHQMPEEVVQSVIDLKAKRFIPGHWGKFALAQHAWKEPINRVSLEAERRQIPIMTPLIGEAVNLNDSVVFTKWWQKVK
jgi:L-ascorbate metabolism protein UlaG (beta-lactamase superfamily)